MGEGADVEDFGRSGGVGEGEEHSVDAVGYVEVAAAESGVAGDVEASGMVVELAAEAEQVAMGLALTDDSRGAEEESAEAVGMGVGGDESFGGQFGGGQERGLVRKRSGFRGGYMGVGAVQAGGARIDEGADAVAAHRFKDVPGDDDVLVEVAARKLGAIAEIGVGSEMEDSIDALADFGDGSEVKEVAENELEAGGGAGTLQKLAPSGDAVINADNFVAIRKQAVDRMTAKKPGRAGN